MADNTTSGNGVPVATRSVTYSGDAAQNVQAVAIVTVAGSDDAKTATDLTLGQATMAASLPVALASNQSALPITDNSGSLTVDAPVGTPVFARLSDGSAALTTAGGQLSVNPATMVSLGQTSWTSATSNNTVVTLATEGYRGLRLVINTNTAASGQLRVFREPIGAPSANEQMSYVLTDQTITDQMIRLRNYDFSGTVGDI